jgi:tripartite-type tricarboxylate transporter receptor subunit TctC
MAAAGVDGVDQTSWLALFGPPGLPAGMRDRLAREAVAVARDPEYQAKFRKTGMEPVGLDAADTAQFYREEVKRWFDLVRSRGLVQKQN